MAKKESEELVSFDEEDIGEKDFRIVRRYCGEKKRSKYFKAVIGNSLKRKVQKQVERLASQNRKVFTSFSEMENLVEKNKGIKSLVSFFIKEEEESNKSNQKEILFETEALKRGFAVFRFKNKDDFITKYESLSKSTEFTMVVSSNTHVFLPNLISLINSHKFNKNWSKNRHGFTITIVDSEKPNNSNQKDISSLKAGILFKNEAKISLNRFLSHQTLSDTSQGILRRKIDNFFEFEEWLNSVLDLHGIHAENKNGNYDFGFSPYEPVGSVRFFDSCLNKKSEFLINQIVSKGVLGPKWTEKNGIKENIRIMINKICDFENERIDKFTFEPQISFGEMEFDDSERIEKVSKIPHNFFQVWTQPTSSKEVLEKRKMYDKGRSTCKNIYGEGNSSWKYHFFIFENGKEIANAENNFKKDRLFETSIPFTLKKFDMVEMNDILRQDIIFQEGGVVVDNDSVCFKRKKKTKSQKGEIVLDMGMVTDTITHDLFNMGYMASCENSDVKRKGLINNAVLASSRGSLVGYYIMRSFALTADSPSNKPVEKTGPVWITTLVNYLSLPVLPLHHNFFYSFQPFHTFKGSSSFSHPSPNLSAYVSSHLDSVFLPDAFFPIVYHAWDVIYKNFNKQIDSRIR